MVGNIHMIICETDQLRNVSFTNDHVYVPYHDPVNRYGMSVSQIVAVKRVMVGNIHMLICETDIP
jgi:hypothetical protein